MRSVTFLQQEVVRRGGVWLFYYPSGSKSSVRHRTVEVILNKHSRYLLRQSLLMPLDNRNILVIY